MRGWSVIQPPVARPPSPWLIFILIVDWMRYKKDSAAVVMSHGYLLQSEAFNVQASAIIPLRCPSALFAAIKTQKARLALAKSLILDSPLNQMPDLGRGLP